MGGSSSSTGYQVQNQTQTQQNQVPSWATPALVGAVQGLGAINPNLTGAEQAALGGLESNAGVLAPFADLQKQYANALYGGGANYSPYVTGAYDQFQQGINPVLNASLDPRNTPGLGDALSALQSDISNQVNSQFAGAGRDLSGINTQALARGVSQGLGGVLANAYQNNVQNRLAAANAALQGGQSTGGLLSNLQQTRLGNMGQGAGAAATYGDITNSPFLQTMAAEAQRRNIPLQTLLAQIQGSLPAAQAFGTTTTTGQGTGMSNQQNQLSGAQQFALLGAGAKSLLGAGGVYPLVG